jgi:hypothetical protein
MYTQSPHIGGILKLTGQFKNKYKRLQRLGDVRFVQITDFETFKKILPEITVQFDFRQGAMFNKNQFLESPAKTGFFLDLFQRGLLHVTLLKLDEDILASMVSIYDKKWLHLQGINTHSPMYAKHSPGILHFYLLGDFIAKEGFEAFDLTPGLDAYKERWATDHDTVCTLVFTNDRKFFIKRFLKKIIHRGFIKIGLRPMTVELRLEKTMYLLRNKKIRKRLKGYLFRDKVTPYAFKLPSSDPSISLEIEKNNLKDLLKYEEGSGDLSRWEFLEKAMKILAEGEDIYSLTNNGILLASVSTGQVPVKNRNSPLLDGIPEHSFYMKDFYLHREHEKHGAAFLISVSELLHNRDKHREMYMLLNKKEHALKRQLGRHGFDFL